MTDKQPPLRLKVDGDDPKEVEIQRGYQQRLERVLRGITDGAIDSREVAPQVVLCAFLNQALITLDAVDAETRQLFLAMLKETLASNYPLEFGAPGPRPERVM